ncbi:site-specific integrase [Mycolicibacterium aubagnense]|uniref:site-specific integrase n=1 Tax=Mycolicibacterium aubagnense TaxID=319707 RepID=UPI0013CFACE8
MDSHPLPAWFADFLNDRQARKLSAHTIKAYRQDFTVIASALTNDASATMSVSDITKDSVRRTFATYAATRDAASVRRCWSTWNVLCTFLYVGRTHFIQPHAACWPPQTLSRALPRPVVDALLSTVSQDVDSTRITDWAERNLATSPQQASRRATQLPAIRSAAPSRQANAILPDLS